MSNTNRWILLIIVWSIVLYLSFIVIHKQCHGTGVSLGYGWDIPVERLQTEDLKLKVIQLELYQEFKSPWYGSVILNGMQGKLNSLQVIDGEYFDGNYHGLGTSVRLGLTTQLLGNLHGSMFGGFGVLMSQLPEICDSGMIGHFGVGVKYVMTNWALGYEWSHTSDPLDKHDKGWNVQFITIGRRI